MLKISDWRQYKSPELTLFDVSVESGFAESQKEQYGVSIDPYAYDDYL